jgi:hypothetical protein
LQSRPRPHDYTHRSVRAHIPIPTRNVCAHIPVPATAVRAHIPVCTIGVRANPSFLSAPAFPLSPIGSAPDIPYAPLRPPPAARLRPLVRRRGGPGGSQGGQGKSDLPWAVSQCPFDPYRAGAKVYRAYRAGRRPAPQTTLGSSGGSIQVEIQGSQTNAREANRDTPNAMEYVTAMVRVGRQMRQAGLLEVF